MSEARSNIYLVGMMGAGKTTIGRALAKRLGRRFVDCDHEIETRSGVRIPVIFEIEGEPGFRKRESATLQDLAAQSGIVLATGGGAVLSADNRALLARTGTVVYLCVPPVILWERTRHDRNRPLLQVGDPRATLEELYRARDPLYREVAHIVIEGGRTYPQAMVRAVEQELQERWQS